MYDKYLSIQKPKRLKTEKLHRKKIHQHLRKKYRHWVLGGGRGLRKKFSLFLV